MKILGLGHSHIVAIAKGCYELQHRGATIVGEAFSSRFVYLYDPEITPTLLGDVEQRRLNRRLAEMIAQEAPQLVLLSVGGNEHIALSVAPPRERMDFILGEQIELPLTEGAMIVPEAAIRETLRDKMGLTLNAIAALRAATPAPMCCLEPPPPLPDSQLLAYPREFFRKAVDRDRLSPEIFRYKIWRVQSGLYREICAARNIEFIEVPDRFVTPRGVLSRDAWGADASHANALFGEAMAQKAIHMLEARLAPAVGR